MPYSADVLRFVPTSAIRHIRRLRSGRAQDGTMRHHRSQTPQQRESNVVRTRAAEVRRVSRVAA